MLVRCILLLLYRFISVPRLSVSRVSLFLCFVIWACPEINALFDWLIDYNKVIDIINRRTIQYNAVWMIYEIFLFVLVEVQMFSYYAIYQWCHGHAFPATGNADKNHSWEHSAWKLVQLTLGDELKGCHSSRWQLTLSDDPLQCLKHFRLLLLYVTNLLSVILVVQLARSLICSTMLA